MLNIVLFGPPGAGKGTQSQFLMDKFHLSHISTGDLFRKHLKEGTNLGKLAQKYMDAGNLVPDEVVIDMVEDKIQSERDIAGFIFDGFPRTVEQAKALDKLLEKTGAPIRGMIALVVPEEELINRLMERGKTSGRVDDQDQEKIAHRIEVYKNETLPVAAYYKKQGKYNNIEGIGSIEEISNRIETVILSYQH